MMKPGRTGVGSVAGEGTHPVKGAQCFYLNKSYVFILNKMI